MLFNFAHKRLTFAITPAIGYTLGFRRRIAHNGLHAETRVLHSCCYLAHLTSLSHLGKEKPEEANVRLWRASASSGNRGPAGLRGLISRLPTLRSLGIVRRFGRVSVPFTNEQCRTQERKVKNRKSPYLEVIGRLQ